MIVYYGIQSWYTIINVVLNVFYRGVCQGSFIFLLMYCGRNVMRNICVLYFYCGSCRHRSMARSNLEAHRHITPLSAVGASAGAL